MEVPTVQILWVCSTDSAEFTQLSWALTHSSVIGLDAEWKPVRSSSSGGGHHESTFPAVSLLQIACRPSANSDNAAFPPPVFLLDLLQLPLPSIYELLKGVFTSPNVLKLGFRFKQDLVYLSSTFCSKGCDPGFDRVEPFIDITTVYCNLQIQRKEFSGRKLPKQSKSLAHICQEVLGVSLSKELQCSDWSHRPLSEEQMKYAAADAECLLQIFNVFQSKIDKEGFYSHWSSTSNPGLKQVLEVSNSCETVLRNNVCGASDMVQAVIPALAGCNLDTNAVGCEKSSAINEQMDLPLFHIVRKYGDKILLNDSDRKPKLSKKKVKRFSRGMTHKENLIQSADDWQGPPPWDLALGGDGCPKFLCDVMVEGLAKHLRCVGIDAAVPHSKKPETRDLIDQAQKEKRVLLTRDAKLLRYNYLIGNQIYRIKNLLKNDQLLEVIETFELKICEDQLMSRCTKCNGKFIQKPLTTEEAVEAAKGFQVIPNCLFNKNLEFWQCMDCRQLYWEIEESDSDFMRATFSVESGDWSYWQKKKKRNCLTY
ncbi:OLC1v1020919C1 [Oldenlandia corymbosa var. corymbosa]|uniref:OLC1v1020919C1 n=1 Tax=Oldenlandia corymbosa var. corymbosa TaxID=529605 RepID=A0AAV1BUI6_OLDCO|nr:OLC1v1020919C1 [Oldenlandia corymbosa var. corymbosa]